jgi:hypothetical protein
VRKDKGLPELKQGDLVEITVNDQNLLVDVHIPGEFNHHRVVGGQLADPLETGHEMAVIRTPDDKEQSHLVRPLARSKMASIPVGADVLFLIDELDKIVDVTFGSKEAVQRAAEASQKMSPIKGNLARVVGTVLQPLKKGDAAVLFVDDDNHVTDVAFVPDGHK